MKRKSWTAISIEAKKWDGICRPCPIGGDAFDALILIQSPVKVNASFNVCYSSWGCIVQANLGVEPRTYMNPEPDALPEHKSTSDKGCTILYSLHVSSYRRVTIDNVQSMGLVIWILALHLYGSFLFI